jgi:hypothetical protein
VSLAIDWCPLERTGEVRRFLDEHWQRGHVLARDEELLRWQYRFPDDPARLSVLLADRGGALVGILGVIQFPFCLDGERLRGAWLTNWMSLRGEHVGRPLVDRVFEEFDVAVVVGVNQLATRVFAELGFEALESIPRWVRVLSTDALRKLVPEMDALPPVVGVGDEIACPWSAATATAWDRTFAQLAPSLRGVWKDADYLDWRYLSHPRFEYRVLVAGEAADALLVYRRERPAGREEDVIRVVDLLGQPAAAAALAAEVLAGESDAAFADFYCTSAKLAAPLEAAGFSPADRLPAFPSRFQPLEPEPRALAATFWASPELGRPFEGDRVYFTRGDSDADRPA